MKTIAKVAIAALMDLNKSLSVPGWDVKYRSLYQGWKSIRYNEGHEVVSINEWRDACSRIISGMICDYQVADKFSKANRSYWTETYNLRVCVTVMGGYRDCPKWETNCKIFLTLH